MLREKEEEELEKEGRKQEQKEEKEERGGKSPGLLAMPIRNCELPLKSTS